MCIAPHNLSSRPTRRRGFSLIELVIVVVIIGIIGAIAIPRMSSSAENAARNAVIGDQVVFQKALDLYEVEHEGVMVHVGAANQKTIYFRLIKRSDLDGTVNESAGIYGPYINDIPANKINGLVSVRIDGVAAGANINGWRYDSTSGVIEPDHLSGTTSFKAESEVLDKVTGVISSKGG